MFWLKIKMFALFLLVQDESQQKHFEEDIHRRLAAGCLPTQSKYHVIPDAWGKCGNGGAIIHALMKLEELYPPQPNGERKLDSYKVLMLPCGGYSQRLPQWGPRGKIFAPVPFAVSDSRPEPCTMLELKLMNYLDIVGKLPKGTIFVAWADVLLFFHAENVDFTRCVFLHTNSTKNKA